MKPYENEHDRNEWLRAKGIDPNEFPYGEIKKEWEGFPIIKEFRNYQKAVKQLNRRLKP